MATLHSLIAVGASVAIALCRHQLCAAQDVYSSGQSPTNSPKTNTLPLRTQQTPAPNYLNPSTNLLLFPTKPEQVQIQLIEPITLQQALSLARRNNRELQTTLFTLERTRASQREAEASRYPTLNGGANLTRGHSLRN